MVTFQISEEITELIGTIARAIPRNVTEQLFLHAAKRLPLERAEFSRSGYGNLLVKFPDAAGSLVWL